MGYKTSEMVQRPDIIPYNITVFYKKIMQHSTI